MKETYFEDQPEEIIDQKETETDEKEKIPSPEEYVNILKEKGFDSHAEAYKSVVDLSQEIKEAGGNAYLVGGCVRDMIVGKISKDFDIEIHGLEAERIEEIAKNIGKVSEVGKAFGILKITLNNGLDLDISLPRRESKISSGHKGFEINTDPHMGIEDACRRRDFTINSIIADPLTGEIKDPFNGVEDIKNRVLKITDIETFKDDPLRVLRALQFVGRFGLEIDSETEEVLKQMAPQLKELPKERLGEEWKKLLLKSEKPSLGLSTGMTLGILKEIHPEFPPLAETPQDKEWHSEGDAWIHTLMVVDEAAKIIKREGDMDEDKSLTIMLASLCHDLGKPNTTLEDEEGRIVSPGHEKKGEEPTKKFLATIGTDNIKRDKVVKLVSNHLAPSLLYIEETVRNHNMDGAVRKLAKRIHPATIQKLVLIAEADHLGRGDSQRIKEEAMLPEDNFPAGEWLLEKARNLKVESSKPAHLIKGQDWMDMGFGGGRHIGELIRVSNELRDELEYSREMVLAMIDNIKEPEEALNILKSKLEYKEA
jgi:tRNA nucleotidyltransferase (CCA-adding enzyme)